jgi:hypothetical protein
MINQTELKELIAGDRRCSQCFARMSWGYSTPETVKIPVIKAYQDFVGREADRVTILANGDEAVPQNSVR